MGHSDSLHCFLIWHNRDSDSTQLMKAFTSAGFRSAPVQQKINKILVKWCLCRFLTAAATVVSFKQVKSLIIFLEFYFYVYNKNNIWTQQLICASQWRLSLPLSSKETIFRPLWEIGSRKKLDNLFTYTVKYVQQVSNHLAFLHLTMA